MKKLNAVLLLCVAVAPCYIVSYKLFTALQAAAGSVAAPPALVPYSSLSDVPRGVWFRGLPPASLHDTVTWSRVTDVEPPFVIIQRRRYLPSELAGRFKYTRDPFVDNPAEYDCLVGVREGDGL